MSKYYSIIDIVNNKFVGTVFNESNNEKVYQTKDYEVQSQAINDINSFLEGKNTQTPITQPNTYTNTIKQAIPTTPASPRRCCGR